MITLTYWQFALMIAVALAVGVLISRYALEHSDIEEEANIDQTGREQEEFAPSCSGAG